MGALANPVSQTRSRKPDLANPVSQTNFTGSNRNPKFGAALPQPRFVAAYFFSGQ